MFLSYLPAGSYVGEMALIDGLPRSATVKAAIKSEVIRLHGRGFRAKLLAQEAAAAAQARPGATWRARAATSTCLHRGAQERVLQRRRHVFGDRAVPDRQRHRRSDRRAANRRDAVRRLRQLREGLRRQPRRPLAARIARRGKTYRPPARADQLPPLRTSALHGRLPAQCDPARPRRRGVHQRHLHRLRQLPAQLPLRRDPHGFSVPPPKPSLLQWLFFGSGPGPGEPSRIPGARSQRRAEARWKRRRRRSNATCVRASRAARPACAPAPPAPRSASRPKPSSAVARLGDEG